MLVAAACVSCFLNASKLPKSRSMASSSSPFGLAAAIRREVLPEQAVQHVAGDVERQRPLERRDAREVAAAARLLQLLARLVRAVDVGLVMLVVVQLHDARRDVRLERAVVVGQVGKHVLRHVRGTPEVECFAAVTRSNARTHFRSTATIPPPLPVPIPRGPCSSTDKRAPPSC